MIKFNVENRWTSQVQFTAEVDCHESADTSLKMGLAVSWAHNNGADLRGADLSGADLSDAYLRGADLGGAYLRGADLGGADLRGAYLRGADLGGADLRGADLSDADLRGADLGGADLSDAYLRGADLGGADLGGAKLPAAPVIPDIHKAVHAAASQDGALDMREWHCGSAHCRAGWVVTLAGEAGQKLEDAVQTPAAAALIYFASDPTMDRVPDFYCDNATALADMARLAGVPTPTAETEG